MSHLIEKYNVPGPRYTSYPTVPYWDLESFSREQWLESVKDSFRISNQSEGISIYIHLPFMKTYAHFVGVTNALPRGMNRKLLMWTPYLQNGI